MSRYTTATQIKTEDKKRRISTVILPPTPVSPRDFYIKTTSPDRLDKLAHEFYEDSSLWWIIASSNNLGKGTLVVPENTILRIPAKAAIQDLVANKNKER